MRQSMVVLSALLVSVSAIGQNASAAPDYPRTGVQVADNNLPAGMTD